MPYYENSPLSAALGFASSYLGAQNQNKKDAQDLQQRQQELAWQHEQQQNAQALALAKFQMDKESAAKIAGMDPASGQTFQSEMPQSMTQVNPGNKGKGGPGSPADHLALAVAQWRYYAQKEGPDGADAQVAKKRVDQIQADITKQGEVQNQWALHNDSMTHGDAQAGIRAGNAAQLHAAPTYSDLNPRPAAVKPPTQQDAQTELIKANNAFTAATTPKTRTDPDTGDVTTISPRSISPQEEAKIKAILPLLQKSSDPWTLSQQSIGSLSTAAQAVVEGYAKAYAAMRAATSSGGSQAPGPFGPVPP